MNIGFDATAATQTAGVGRYARELLRSLVSTQVEHRYTLLMTASEDQAAGLLDVLPPGAWREAQRVPGGVSAMNEVWQRVQIPIRLNRYTRDVDVMHFPDFVIPPVEGPSVVTIHDLSFVMHPEYAEPSLARYLKKAVPSAIERASAIIAVSASTAFDIVETFPDSRDRIFAIPNGVSVPATIPEKQTSDRPRILMVGTIEPRKNHLGLLAAMKLVWHKLPEAELVIAGREGWQAAQIVEAIAIAGSDGQVNWIREPSDAKLVQLYANADVVVCPSHYEGFGLPILEAMAFGIPVIANDTPALRETGGDVALYTLSVDAEQLADCILSLLQNASLQAELSVRGRHRAEQFSWDQTARKTVRAYEFAARST